MKTQIFLISLLTLSGFTLFFQEQDSYRSLQATKDSDLFNTFIQWKQQFNQKYSKNEEEYRFEAFKENYNYIQKANAESKNLVLGLNQFAAMTNEEFKSLLSSKINVPNKSQKKSVQQTKETIQLPLSVDWVQAGAVTEAGEQGFCDAGYAFASSASVEGARFIKQNVLEKLSKQQLISCIRFPLSLGCGGGNAENAITYMNQNGISTELDYPFVQQWTLVTIQANNPNEMKQALSKQPIVASIASGSLAFQLYKSGVISNCHGDTDINHYVLLVGYNDLENSWTFKNSWGQTWGMQGYAKITIEQGNGLCGINMDVSHPKL